MGDFWRRCSSCKTEIAHGATYWVCSVSTCNRKRTGLAFCTTECWDAHLGYVNHRESWAVEEKAPSSGSPAVVGSASEPRRRRIVAARTTAPKAPASEGPREVLIVASRLKEYVRAVSGMNTSEKVLEVLSDEVRSIVDRAIQSARRAERKTILERDFSRRS